MKLISIDVSRFKSTLFNKMTMNSERVAIYLYEQLKVRVLDFLDVSKIL